MIEVASQSTRSCTASRAFSAVSGCSIVATGAFSVKSPSRGAEITSCKARCASGLLSRVHQILGVKRPLDLAVQFERAWTPLKREAPALLPAEAVLAGDRAPEPHRKLVQSP